jgi:uncharacterized protein YceK
MRLLLVALVLLSGCASVTERAEPYFDMKVVWQNDSGSDWMLRSSRSWVNDGKIRYQAAVGIEWDHNIDCPFLAVSYQSLNWAHIGCAKSWGGKPDKLVKPFFQVDLRHQVDSMSDWWLRTDHPDLRKTHPDLVRQNPNTDIVRYNAAYHDRGIKWTGQNPFYHLRLGLEWKMTGHESHKIFRFKCPVIATGRSLTQGFPYESENNGRQADLYWSHLECRVRMGGK